MRKRCILLVLILFIHNTAIAGVWGFKEKFAGRTNVPYKEIVQEIYDRWTVEPTSPNFDLFNDFRDQAKAIFEPTGIEIRFRVKRLGENENRVLASGTMYFSRGDFYLRYDDDPSHEREVWHENYATIGRKLYQWRPGANEGRILTRFPGDTVELIDYLVDPSMIMRYMYMHYLRSPNEFNVVQDEEQQALMLKEAYYNFLGIRIIEKPLWFCAFIANNPRKREDDRLAFEVDPPRPVDRIPARFRTLPEGVTFERSEQTVESVLTYL